MERITIHNLCDQDRLKFLEGREFFRDGDFFIPKVRYKIIRGIEHYKSMSETFVERNRTYQKTDSIHQFPGHDEFFAVYTLINE